MSDLSLLLEPETPDDAAAIEQLNERVFGPGRFARSAYRVRETADPDPALSFVARVGTLLVGANCHDAHRNRRRAGAAARAADRRAGVPQPGHRRSAGHALARGGEGGGLEARHPRRRRALLCPDGLQVGAPGPHHAAGPVDPARLLYCESSRRAGGGEGGGARRVTCDVNRQTFRHIVQEPRCIWPQWDRFAGRKTRHSGCVIESELEAECFDDAEQCRETGVAVLAQGSVQRFARHAGLLRDLGHAARAIAPSAAAM